MITKGVVYKIIDAYNYKVRIPILDKIAGAASGTSNDGLATALVCCSPGCKTYFSPGDVVYVAFEESKAAKPVIIGQLYRDDLTGIESQTVIDTTIINANIEANLPEKTTIGNVSPEALKSLEGAKNNIQKQLDFIEERLSVFDKLPREEGDFKLHVTETKHYEEETYTGSTYSYSWVKM